jgi:SWI/SNF-related matrix-associated actin-dependent regulator 1 of chromatin subfamily A
MAGTVTFQGGVYIWQGPFEDRGLPDMAGFVFDFWVKKSWATNCPVLASNMLGLFDSKAKTRFELDRATVKAALIRSMADAPTGPCPYTPPKGKKLLPYQSAGISASVIMGSVLLADEMGLGKTIQGIGIIEAVKARRVLVVCPAFLKLNWKKEMAVWSPGRKVEVVSGKVAPAAGAENVVINYDILHNHTEWMNAEPWDAVIFDEAHYMKNASARRTALSLGGKYKRKGVSGIPARRRIYLTGTPIDNAPHELHPVLSREMPNEFGNYEDFTRRYSTGFMMDRTFIITGGKNMGELQNRLRSTFMIRRLKKDVLTQLPAKRREIIELQIPGIHKLIKEETNILKNRTVEQIIDGYEKESLQLGEMAKLRKAIGMAKVATCVKFIEGVLQSKNKVIVFGHHKDVLKAIVKAIPDSSLITGDVPMNKRESIVRDFQEGPVRCFVGNIQAAGVGLTLTASDVVIFVEPDWSPSKMIQAEDRAHRIGQLLRVHVMILVASGSMEVRIMQALIKKQEIIEKTLDSKEDLMV